LAERLQKLNFPNDHFWHNTTIEWIYFWGRLDNGKFFHFAEFLHKFGKYRANFRHWSYDGEFGEEIDDHWGDRVSSTGFTIKGFSFNSPRLGLTFQPKCKPVIHNTILNKGYYSIPYLEGEGYLYPAEKVKARAWFDHEWNDTIEGLDWEWVGLNLDCGMNIMAHRAADFKICDITLNGTTFESDFILDGRHFFLHATGMYLILNPLGDEKIFDPKLGVKYSEQPFEVISKGGVIGYGMRERTYKNKEI